MSDLGNAIAVGIMVETVMFLAVVAFVLGMIGYGLWYWLGPIGVCI